LTGHQQQYKQDGVVSLKIEVGMRKKANRGCQAARSYSMYEAFLTVVLFHKRSRVLFNIFQ